MTDVVDTQEIEDSSFSLYLETGKAYNTKHRGRIKFEGYENQGDIDNLLYRIRLLERNGLMQYWKPEYAREEILFPEVKPLMSLGERFQEAVNPEAHYNLVFVYDVKEAEALETLGYQCMGGARGPSDNQVMVYQIKPFKRD